MYKNVVGAVVVVVVVVLICAQLIGTIRIQFNTCKYNKL
jgi:hypothetical protein